MQDVAQPWKIYVIVIPNERLSEPVRRNPSPEKRIIGEWLPKPKRATILDKTADLGGAEDQWPAPAYASLGR